MNELKKITHHISFIEEYIFSLFLHFYMRQFYHDPGTESTKSVQIPAVLDEVELVLCHW